MQIKLDPARHLSFLDEINASISAIDGELSHLVASVKTKKTRSKGDSVRRALGPLTLALALIGALSGCATAASGVAVDETLDVYGAKAVAQSMENELASYVPAGSVAATEQLDKGILLGCGADGIYQWTGHNYLTLSSPVDDKKVVDEVVAGFADRPPFAALADKTHDGAPSALVVGPAGSSYSLTLSVDRSRIEIFSFSPCFRLPDDMSRRADY